MQPQSESPTQPAAKKILVIEDNQALAEIYKTRLEILGYTVYIGYNGITGLYFAQQELPDLVLLDLMIPDIAGDEVLDTMRRSDWGKNIPVYIISNLNESEAPRRLRELGISGYSVKANLTDDMIDQIVNKILRPEMAGPRTGYQDQQVAGPSAVEI
jgi:DNA-binding response OmpR family regulator